MADATPVDRLYEESVSVVRALSAAEPSLAISASDTFRKTLVLASASYFEHRVSACVADFVHERASGSTLVVSFVKNKAINRQYHTWFSWSDSNANNFFALFGVEFRQMMQERVKSSDELRAAITSFLEIGNERNKLVHQDFASFPFEKTLEETYGSYKKALPFVDSLSAHLRECKPGARADAGALPA